MNPADEDATRPATGGSAAGDDRARTTYDALATGTRLLEFEILEVVGGGGFGIVYRAYDHDLRREVALKEYLPSTLARRGEGLRVAVTAGGAETFATGLRSFVNEARLLAQFDHPSLVKVYRFWEANGTAYMVMPYYRAPTLGAAVRGRADVVGESWLRAMLAHLLEALQILHDKQCLHRDVAPDNILMIEEDRPLLLDFGAARHVAGDASRALTVIYKPSYAPIEQHADAGTMKQGPWTDLYALSAVAHFAIVGAPPPSALQRLVQDTYDPLARRAAGRFDRRLLEGLDRGLSLRPEDRPQSVAAMRALLGVGVPQPVATAPFAGEKARGPGLDPPLAARKRGSPIPLALGGLVAVAVAVWIAWPDAELRTRESAGPEAVRRPDAAHDESSRRGVEPPDDAKAAVREPRSSTPSRVESVPPLEQGGVKASVSVQAPLAQRGPVASAPAVPPPSGRAGAAVGGTGAVPPSKPAGSRVQSARCSELLLRQSLGEPLSAADLDHFHSRCQ